MLFGGEKLNYLLNLRVKEISLVHIQQGEWIDLNVNYCLNYTIGTEVRAQAIEWGKRTS